MNDRKHKEFIEHRRIEALRLIKLFGLTVIDLGQSYRMNGKGVDVLVSDLSVIEEDDINPNRLFKPVPVIASYSH